MSVNWVHSGSGVAYFTVARQSPPWTWGNVSAAQRNLPDCDLQPSTAYSYQVCAFFITDDGDSECSEWSKPERTLPPEQPRTSQRPPTPRIVEHHAGETWIGIKWEAGYDYDSYFVNTTERVAPGQPPKGPRTIHHDDDGTWGYQRVDGLLPGRTYILEVQGCTERLGGILDDHCWDWSAAYVASTPPPPPAAPRPTPTATSTPVWVLAAEISGTKWGFTDANRVGWAQAARAAAAMCYNRGFVGGHFDGHQDLAKGGYGIQCSGAGTVWFDITRNDMDSRWAFSDVNTVSWAQANRVAERYCATRGQGFAGGHFNGHMLDGKYGLFCYKDGAQWFDATTAQLAATGWGFATPKLDDVPWAQAARAAVDYCRTKGFSGGFMTGHYVPGFAGVVCQK